MAPITKSARKFLLLGIISICVIGTAFGLGHHYGLSTEAKGNSVFNVIVLTDIYEHLETNDLNMARNRLRFMITGNVMIHDQIFGQSIPTDSVSIRRWTHAREIAREEQTNLVPVSELINKLNEYSKTNKATFIKP